MHEQQRSYTVDDTENRIADPFETDVSKSSGSSFEEDSDEEEGESGDE